MISGPNLYGSNEAEILKNKQVLMNFYHLDELAQLLVKIQETDQRFYQKMLQKIYKKNAVDNYSTLIIDDIQKQLFSSH
jgi:hypothetical protein